MNIAIIIPAYNEEDFIEVCLNSLLNQTFQAIKILVVDDGSTDKTTKILEQLSKANSNLSFVKREKSLNHEPGSKIIKAFNYGLESLKEEFDVICKFDADLIFPENYLEKLATAYREDEGLGMFGGFCQVEIDGRWEIERLTNQDHLRGALKSYRKECFDQINGLLPAMGWDTVDEMKARFHGWEVETNPKLLVKHLKPTGQHYKKELPEIFGVSLYRMRYSWSLALITCLKMAKNKSSFSFFQKSITSFLRSNSKKNTFLVSDKEGVFIRKYRWKKIKERLI